MELAPIALFVYNRPDHTRQTVESLLKNSPAAESDLFIFSDGPKDRSVEENVRKVRKYIKTIDGFKSVNINENKQNMGCANSIIAGVTDLCKRFGKVIVIEDDLIVSPNFLEYMNTALKRYEQDEGVMQVSGYMYPIDLNTETDAVFMPLSTSWGWATWKRAWAKFDPLMLGYEAIKNDRAMRQKFDLDGAYPCFDMLVAQKKGKIDSWAIRWYLSVFMAGGLVLHPAISLVKNIGFDNSGIHCTTSTAKFTTSLNDFRVLTFPFEPEPAWQAYEICRSFLKGTIPTFVSRLKELFNELVKKAI